MTARIVIILLRGNNMTLTTYLDMIRNRIMVLHNATFCSVATQLNRTAVDSDMNEVDPSRFEQEVKFYNAGFHVKAQAYKYFEYLYDLSGGEDVFLQDVVLNPIESMAN
jgi:hypothetical protein